MNEYYEFKCTNPLCTWSGKRYRNTKWCGLCGYRIHRVDPPSKDTTIKQLAQKVVDLENELQMWKESISETVPINVENMTVEQGNITKALLSGSPVSLLIAGVMEMFEKSPKAENYLSFQFGTKEDYKKYEVIFQKAAGLTPAQKNVVLTKKVEDLVEVLKKIDLMVTSEDFDADDVRDVIERAAK